MNIETTVLSAVLFVNLTIVLQAAGIELEKEVNNSILQPNTISMGTNVAAAIKAKDTDYFRDSTTGKYHLTVEQYKGVRNAPAQDV